MNEKKEGNSLIMLKDSIEGIQTVILGRFIWHQGD
jgi:hypothetical protein